jgi:TolB protein
MRMTSGVGMQPWMTSKTTTGLGSPKPDHPDRRSARGRRRARVVGVVVVALTLLGRSAPAQVRGTIIGPGETAFPIALAPLGGSGGEACRSRFEGTLSRDLDLSGLFRVLAEAASPGAGGGPDQAEVDFAAWAGAGARLLVMGTCSVDRDDVTVEARLYDVAEQRELGGKRYRGTRSDVRGMGHRFADEVMRLLTGERGPFNTRIAFVSTRAGRAKEIFEMGLDGEDVSQLTRNGTINLSPSWSPDGRQLLFTSFRDGRPKLYQMDVASDRQRVLLEGAGLTNGGRFSPDGDLVAASREESKGNSEIILVDREGSLVRRLASHGGIDVSPTWSPDGRQVAFCSTRGGAPQIYATDAGGGAVRRVTYQGSYNTSPVWSPRGDLIAYTGRVGGRFQIFVVPAGGGESQQLTASAGDNTDPTWSPDGRYLLFSSTRGGAPQLYMMDSRGLRQRQLIRSPGGDTSPTWSSWID